MRRPPKPFVTEYKNTNRKPKDFLETVAPARSAEPPQEFAPEGARTPPPSGDDSYEAALRAADALFAAKSNAAISDESSADSSNRAEHLGGRILQAIDENAVDPLAALEAERAPKRRGRKPGSKNRPKLPIAPVETGVPVQTRPQRQPAEAAMPALLATPPSTPRLPRERFAWVRTTLRPGERWKRRLPKVAW